jgi:hypothetical protein
MSLDGNSTAINNKPVIHILCKENLNKLNSFDAKKHKPVLAQTAYEGGVYLLEWNDSVNGYVYENKGYFKEDAIKCFWDISPVNIDTDKLMFESIALVELMKDFIPFATGGFLGKSDHAIDIIKTINPGEMIEVSGSTKMFGFLEGEDGQLKDEYLTPKGVMSEQEAKLFGEHSFAFTKKEYIPVKVKWFDIEGVKGWVLQDGSGYFKEGTLIDFMSKYYFKEYNPSNYDGKILAEDLIKINEDFLTLEKEVKEQSKYIVDKVVEETVKEGLKALSFEDIIDEKYAPLWNVLARAFEQASAGKGKERHGNGKPFLEQPMFSICSMLRSNHFLIGQAVKKAQESSRMDKDRAVKELLGAINYLAGAVIYLENEDVSNDQ